MRIFILSKKTGILYSILFLLIAALLFIGRQESINVSNIDKDMPICNVEKKDNEKIISLSFDIAYGNNEINKVSDILNKYNIKATFFTVGGWAEKNTQIIKKLASDGNEVMNHSNTHPHIMDLSVEKIIEEIEWCDKKIEDITGTRPQLFRAPYNEYNDKVLQAIKQTGHIPIQWDVDSLDWKGISADEIYNRVSENSKPGSIVLFHASEKNTTEALPKIIEKFQKEGYEILPVSQMIYKEKYIIDSTGKQKKSPLRRFQTVEKVQ